MGARPRDGKDIAYWYDRAMKAEAEVEAARRAAQLNQGRCFRAFDPELKMWLHIPWCGGAAVNGPDQCTCTFPESGIERARREAEEVKAEMHELRQRYAVKFQRLESRARWFEASRDEARAERDAALALARNVSPQEPR